MSANSDQPALNNTERLWTVIQMLFGLITTVNLAVTSWALVTLVDLQNEMSSIKADRYTIADAHEDQVKQAENLLSVWQEISEIKQQLGLKIDAKDVPPPHVQRWLERHDREIERLEATNQ